MPSRAASDSDATSAVFAERAPPRAHDEHDAATAAIVGVERYHELRVRIPTDVHRQLLALKILRGVTLAESVVIALDRYFAQRQMPVIEELVKPAKSP